MRRGINLKENNTRDRILSPEEYERLIKTAQESLQGMIRMAYHTGMRVSEISGLTWDKVDLKEGLITLRPQDTKTNEGRAVPLTDELIQYLENLPRHIRCPYVFPYKGRKYTYYRRAWMSALKRAVIEDFRFHDLRHTFVTNKRREGIHDFVIMKITGHKTLSTFRRYNTVDIEELKKAVRPTSKDLPDDPTLPIQEKSMSLSAPKVLRQVPHEKNKHVKNRLST